MLWAPLPPFCSVHIYIYIHVHIQRDRYTHVLMVLTLDFGGYRGLEFVCFSLHVFLFAG